MNWTEARDRSLEQWRTILTSIGQRDPNELVVWTFSAYGLCDKAAELAEDEGQLTGSVCRFCLAFQQQGGCLEARDRLIGALISGDLDRAREVVHSMIADLEALEVAGMK
ncbi:MAG TPA: hypothetical protein VLE27_06770 [Thermoanaerobaculia bacterium]|nr:hypothetical protein [Thermoanaerobaculia bacterium]